MLSDEDPAAESSFFKEAAIMKWAENHVVCMCDCFQGSGWALQHCAPAGCVYEATSVSDAHGADGQGGSQEPPPRLSPQGVYIFVVS
jgi:hypothetical protein